jgi:hypothetical protein
MGANEGSIAAASARSAWFLFELHAKNGSPTSASGSSHAVVLIRKNSLSWPRRAGKRASLLERDRFAGFEHELDVVDPQVKASFANCGLKF